MCFVFGTVEVEASLVLELLIVRPPDEISLEVFL